MCDSRLATEAELVDQRAVMLDVAILHVVQHAPATPDHHQKSTTTVMVLGMRLQMLGQAVDAIRQEGNLHIGRPRVGGVRAVRGDDLALGRGDHGDDAAFRAAGAAVGRPGPDGPSGIASEPEPTRTPSPYRRFGVVQSLGTLTPWRRISASSGRGLTRLTELSWGFLPSEWTSVARSPI